MCQMREANHSLPSNVKIKSEWNCTSNFPYAVFEETLVDMSNKLARGRRVYCTRCVAGCVPEMSWVLYKEKNLEEFLGNMILC